MDKRTIDISGQRFGKLTVIAYIGKKVWRCTCDCGQSIQVRGALLRNGHTKSCGCNNGAPGVARKHGATSNGKQTPEYSAWLGMRDRCNNTNNQNYNDYGGRGISVCDRWDNSFENFFADMGKKPDGMTLDRIDNSKGYSPENCRWASYKQQANNRREKKISVMYELFGETKTLCAWAKDPRCVVCYQTLYYRVVTAKKDLRYAMSISSIV